MYAVAVTFTLKPGCREAFMARMLPNAEASRGEPACRYFDVCTDPERPEHVFLYELYDDRAGFDAHLAAPHFLAFAEAVAEMVEDRAFAFYPEVGP